MSNFTAARKAIDEVFNDVSVSQAETRDKLEQLSEHIDSLLGALDVDNDD